MLVFYVHVLLKKNLRVNYAYFIPNAVDDLGLMTDALLSARDGIETPKFVKFSYMFSFEQRLCRFLTTVGR